MNDTNHFRALFLRKDTEIFGKVDSLVYGRLQKFGGIVPQNQAPNAFPCRTQLALGNAYCQ
jgi:hypothetical protein